MSEELPHIAPFPSNEPYSEERSFVEDHQEHPMMQQLMEEYGNTWLVVGPHFFESLEFLLVNQCLKVYPHLNDPAWNLMLALFEFAISRPSSLVRERLLECPWLRVLFECSHRFAHNDIHYYSDLVMRLLVLVFDMSPENAYLASLCRTLAASLAEVLSTGEQRPQQDMYVQLARSIIGGEYAKYIRPQLQNRLRLLVEEVTVEADWIPLCTDDDGVILNRIMDQCRSLMHSNKKDDSDLNSW